MNLIELPTFNGELEPKIQQIAEWLASNGISAFWGELEQTEGLPTASWDTAHSDSIEPFLAAARQLKAQVVYVDCTRCDLSGFAKKGVPPDLQRRAASLEDRTGQVVELCLSWLAAGVLHRLVLHASWSDGFFELTEELDQQGDDEDDEEDGLDEAEVRQLAQLLASNAKFQSARSAAQRTYAARKCLDAAATEDRYILSAVIAEAKNIFEMELRPELDRLQSEQVQVLKEQGLTKAQIARKLGISANRMKTMF